MATFVLIPGAGGDPWEWHRLVPELEALGHDAVAVRLPSGDDAAGWAEYAGAVVEAIGDRGSVRSAISALGDVVSTAGTLLQSLGTTCPTSTTTPGSTPESTPTSSG